MSTLPYGKESCHPVLDADVDPLAPHADLGPATHVHKKFHQAKEVQWSRLSICHKLIR